jgi:hypothetical protein
VSCNVPLGEEKPWHLSVVVHFLLLELALPWLCPTPLLGLPSASAPVLLPLLLNPQSFAVS